LVEILPSLLAPVCSLVQGEKENRRIYDVFPGQKWLSASIAAGEGERAIKPWARIWHGFIPCWSKPKDMRMAASSNWFEVIPS
jgi:hypothetical protein